MDGMISALPLKLKFLLVLNSVPLEWKSNDLGWLRIFKSIEKEFSLLVWGFIIKERRTCFHSMSYQVKTSKYLQNRIKFINSTNIS